MIRARAVLAWCGGLATGAVFLWLAVRSIDLKAALAAVAGADELDILAVVGFSLAWGGVKTLRWVWLTRHLRPMAFRRLLGPVLAGAAVNYALPHAGEFVRAWMAARGEHLPTASLLASIVVERILDFCAVMLLALVGVFAAGTLLGIGAYLWVIFGLIVAMLAAIVPFLAWPSRALAVSRALLEPLPRRAWIIRQLEHGVGGLRSLERARTLFAVLGASIVQWSMMAASVWLSLHAVGIAPTLALALALLLFLVVGMTLPTAPAAVGTTQLAFLLGGSTFAVVKEEALAASLIFNVFLPGPLFLCGAWAIVRAWHGPSELSAWISRSR